jgi:tetratricopeptide (TPR) repeat protein
MLSTKKVEEGRYRAHSLEKIYKKALEWFDEGSYDQSKVKAKEVLELDENDEGAEALLNLIQAHRYLEMSKYNKALKEVLLAMEADPDNERARNMLKKMKELILLMDLE